MRCVLLPEELPSLMGENMRVGSGDPRESVSEPREPQSSGDKVAVGYTQGRPAQVAEVA